MQGNQFVATEDGFPFALAAGNQNDLVRRVSQPVERALDRHLAAAPFRRSRARIGEHVGPDDAAGYRQQPSRFRLPT
jgi:hypothetical protein